MKPSILEHVTQGDLLQNNWSLISCGKNRGNCIVSQYLKTHGPIQTESTQSVLDDRIREGELGSPNHSWNSLPDPNANRLIPSFLGPVSNFWGHYAEQRHVLTKLIFISKPSRVHCWVIIYKLSLGQGYLSKRIKFYQAISFRLLS